MNLGLLRSTAAASVLAALGSRIAAAPLRDGRPAPAPLQPGDAAGGGAVTIAGVVILTRPGAGPRVAARLATVAGLSLAGGDGSARVGAVCELRGAQSLEALGERLLASDPDIVGVHATFVGHAAE